MDSIANMLTQIKNGQAVQKDHVVVPFSKMKLAIASILRSEGFISDIERKMKKAKKSEHEYLHLVLKYDEDGQGAISDVRRVSRLSRRMYIGVDEIKPVRSGYGIAVLSTPKGVLSSRDARKQGVGGEVLFEIY